MVTDNRQTSGRTTIAKHSAAITTAIPLAERCLKTGATVLRHNGKSFDAASTGSAPLIPMGHPRDHRQPTRGDARSWRRPGAVRQGGSRSRRRLTGCWWG